MEAVLRASKRRAVLAALCAVLVAVPVAGCLPQERGEAREVPEGDEAPAAPPSFPDSGPIPAETLVEALVYDFTAAPSDPNLWVPSLAEARCAAEGIVEGLGAPRLAELGYRPATSGASLNDVGLTTSERAVVTERVRACVDLTRAIGALLMGDGQLTGPQAACMAEGLAGRGLVDDVVVAWVVGRTFDPLAGDGALADGLLSYAEVCLPDNAFGWTDANLPEEDVTGTARAGAPTTTVPGQPDGLSSRTGSATSVPGGP